MRRCWALLLVGLVGGCHVQPPPTMQERYARAWQELKNGDLRRAQDHAEEGERLARQVGDSGAAWSFTVLRALILCRGRHWREAIDLLRAPPPPEAAGRDKVIAMMAEGYARCTLATVGDSNRADLGPAEARLEQARRAAAALPNPELQGEVALRQAICQMLKGDHGAAEVVFRDALDLARKSRLRRLEAEFSANMGLLRLRTGHWDDAADWLDQSLRISTELDARSLDASVLGNLGWAYTELGDTERALPALLRGKELAEARGYRQEIEKDAGHLGSVYLQLGDLDRARQSYEEGLALARELRLPADERWFLQVLQKVALRAGDHARAEDYARQAQSLEAQGTPAAKPVPSLTEAEVYVERQELDRAARHYERIIASPDVGAEDRWRAYFGLARLAVRKGRLAEAERRYRQAQQAIEAMRREVAEDTYEFLLFSSLREFHDSYIGFLVDQGRTEDALGVAEHGRGRVMWERLKGPVAEPAAADFVRVAGAYRAIVLAYWLGRERSYLWVVTPRAVSVHSLPPAGTLRSQVERYQALLQRSRDPLESGATEAAALYQTLVGPAAATIPKGSRVVLLPDGPLHQLSFDALVVPTPHPHYWVEDVVVVRTPSLRVLAAARAVTGSRQRALLVIGDPEPASDLFPPPPNVGEEIRQVQRHFPGAERVALTRSAAHPLAYRESDPARFGLVHFAAHATAHPDRPLDSAVVLSRKGLDYKLYARDIVEVPTNADVVTLSTCRGAGARVYSGEGLVGFAWAFLTAGAQHVVAGLWDVEDASTAKLMDRMYEELARGAAPPEALRIAKLALLHSQTAYRKPYYWGPFVVYTQRQGRNRPA
jgi:CHAT domain-containing protein